MDKAMNLTLTSRRMKHINWILLTNKIWTIQLKINATLNGQRNNKTIDRRVR